MALARDLCSRKNWLKSKGELWCLWDVYEMFMRCLWDVYEIFSGPLFAKEIKDFIENVAQNFMDSDQTPEESVVMRLETDLIKDSLKCVF
jgi:hypothetical protein